MPTNSNKLFEPAQAGAIKLANRIVMAPMTRNRADREAVPSPIAPDYYRQRSTAGLIVTEATQVSQQGQGYALTPGIFNARQVDAWRKVTAAVHVRGGRIVLQLWHVGRISHRLLQPGGALPVAPSAIKPEGQTFTYEGLRDFETPRALETDEIPGIVAQFRAGAEHAKAAGFDGVEIHGANGYLIDQFLRDGTNHRTDAYGGSIENRTRLLLEVVDAVTGVWERDRVGVRLSPLGGFNSMSDSDPATHFAHVVQALDDQGLAYLHLVETGDGPVPDMAEKAKIAHIKAPWKGFYIAAGGYDRERAIEAVSSGWAGAVAFGKPFISNPDLVERLRSNAPLAAYDTTTFYAGGEKGYVDYPPLPKAA